MEGLVVPAALRSQSPELNGELSNTAGALAESEKALSSVLTMDVLCISWVKAP